MRVLRALSLDVVAGAACGGLLAEHMSQARMLPAWWVALLAAVWCIYTGDHLLDARRRAKEPRTYRHAFHRRHARVLTLALTGGVIVGLSAASTLRPPVRLFGLGMSLSVVLYLASAQGLILAQLPKEPVAGLLYAAGIWGGPIAMADGPATGPLLAASLHAVAAILNLVMVGVFEITIDRDEGHRSVARAFGRDSARTGVMAASVLGSLAAAAIAFALPAWRAVFAILAVQVATPGLLLRVERWFGEHERYRFWGDSVFLLGAIPRLSA